MPRDDETQTTETEAAELVAAGSSGDGELLAERTERRGEWRGGVEDNAARAFRPARGESERGT